MRHVLISFLSTFFVLFSAMSTGADDSVSKLEREPLTYQGWAAIKRKVLDPEAGDDEWVAMRGIEVSDVGTKLRLTGDGEDTPFTIELIVITYEKTNTTVLKLALYEEGKDKAVTYIWGEPGAQRLGMNLRWIQVGLTRLAT